jgi:pyruvate/2-oxoglutarate dehydrogenase complex dihydrolipoamide acyltransferase (E2) component
MLHSLNTPWRQLTAAIFDPPRQPNIHTGYSVRAETLESYLRSTRRPGVSLRPVHFVAAAIGRALAEDVPGLNAFVHRGSIRPRSDVTVTVTAPLPGQAGLLHLNVPDAHLRVPPEIAADWMAALRERKERFPSGRLPPEYTLTRIPWPLRRGAFRLLRGLSEGMGIGLKPLDMAAESLGAVFLSDYSRFSARIPEHTAVIESGALPLFPAARAAAFMSIGHIHDRVVAEGGRVVVARTLPVTCTFDHRVVDADDVFRFNEAVAHRLQDPEALALHPTSDKA